MDLKQATELAGETQGKLDAKYGKHDAYRLVTELAEEVGEVAEAVKAEEGVAGKEKHKGKIGSELADVLYQVCALSSKYGTDLEKDFQKVLNGINERYLK